MGRIGEGKGRRGEEEEQEVSAEEFLVQEMEFNVYNRVFSLFFSLSLILNTKDLPLSRVQTFASSPLLAIDSWVRLLGPLSSGLVPGYSIFLLGWVMTVADRFAPLRSSNVPQSLLMLPWLNVFFKLNQNYQFGSM